MSDFEGLFGLIGIMFGLFVAELSIKFADAIDGHRDRPVGVLTPTLAFLVLTDVTSILAEHLGRQKRADHHLAHGLRLRLVAIVYFLAASLVFPRTKLNWDCLDDHYWSRKRSCRVWNAFREPGDGRFHAEPSHSGVERLDVLFPALPGALFGLIFSRSRRNYFTLLAVAIFVNLASGSDALPASRWGQQIGLTMGHDRKRCRPTSDQRTRCQWQLSTQS